MSTSEAPVIVDATGRPARGPRPDPACPRCRAGVERRVLSAGFGAPHDVCGQCGHEFAERTLAFGKGAD